MTMNVGVKSFVDIRQGKLGRYTLDRYEEMEEKT